MLMVFTAHIVYPQYNLCGFDFFLWNFILFFVLLVWNDRDNRSPANIIYSLLHTLCVAVMIQIACKFKSELDNLYRLALAERNLWRPTIMEI